jgi:hypothetical protein
MTTTSGVEDRRGEESGTTSVEEVVLGVDTHLDAHVAVALDGLGRRLGELSYRRPGRATSASSPGRKASDPCGALAWRVRAATAPGWPAT